MLPKEYQELARLFPSLYAVGGCVRDALLGSVASDVDLASPLTPSEVSALLEGTQYTVVPVSPRLGTVLIRGGGICAEYTTFRKDSYPEGRGNHTPAEVVFSPELKEDAVRRDFSVNALYFDLKNGCIVDEVGGLFDLQHKTLRAVTSPDKVFSEDGLRILRLARFAAELDFQIEQKTFAAAKQNAAFLADISVERMADELRKILVSDTRHPVLHAANAPERGLQIMTDLGATAYVLPELAACVGVPQNPLYHKYDVFWHTLKTVSASPPDVRLAALFHDLGKPVAVEQDGNMYRHPEIGAEIARKRLRLLRFSNKEIEETERLVSLHMKDMREDMKEGKLRVFLVENADIAEKLFALKKADIAGTGTAAPVTEIRMERVYRKMREDGTPFSVKDLLVGGDDLVRLGVPPEQRAEYLRGLLHEAVLNSVFRTREKQLKYLERRSIL